MLRNFLKLSIRNLQKNSLYSIIIISGLAVGIAFVIAGPLSWYLMDTYLERYVIRVELAWWVILMAGFVALAFALVIVANQARRAAVLNPVHSLRNE